MAPNYLLSIALCLGLFGLQINANINVNENAPRSLENPVKVPPVRVEDFFPHLQKRDNDWSRLDLQKEVRLMWAINTTTEKVVFDMMLQQPDPDHPLLALEDLDSLAESIACREPDITLKFGSKEAMDRAIKAWDWINEAEADYFYLIANHNGCGPDAERYPYKVIGVQYDHSALTAKLTTQTTTWEEAVKNHEMWVGSSPHHQGPLALAPQQSFNNSDAPASNLTQKASLSQDSESDLSKRWNIEGVIDSAVGIFVRTRDVFVSAGKFVVAVVKLLNGGDIEFDVSGKYNAPIFHSAESVGGKDVPVRFYIDCEDCHTTGKLLWSARWKLVNHSFKELVVKGRPTGVAGKVSIKAKVEADIEGFSKKNLVPIPGISPLTIGPVTIGPQVLAGLGVEGKIKGNGVFTTGLEWSVPDTANIEIHSLRITQSKASGFGGAMAKPSFNVDELNASGELTFYAILRFALAVTAGKSSHGFRTDLKTGFKASLAVGILAKDACKGQLGEAQSFGAKIAASRTLEVITGIGFEDTPADIEYKLHEDERQIAGVCFAAPIIPARAVGKLPEVKNDTSPRTQSLVQKQRGTEAFAPGSIMVKGKAIDFVRAG
ncbi:hypothetical protein TWF481_006070 [Arthrobotrys musiformis]|uniref:Uncharacterized protein n=1 Tax=Arthrobotrys musiformis TaxID=47236 RepID=A0AAV9WH06_9PEZI